MVMLGLMFKVIWMSEDSIPIRKIKKLGMFKVIKEYQQYKNEEGEIEDISNPVIYVYIDTPMTGNKKVLEKEYDDAEEMEDVYKWLNSQSKAQEFVQLDGETPESLR